MSHETVTTGLNTRPKTSDMLPNKYETLPFPTIFDSPQDRIQFLSHVYISKESNRYAELSHGTSTPKEVFELPNEVFWDYIAAITDSSPRTELRGKVGLQNRFATTPPDTFGLDSDRADARRVSISGEKVRGLAIDPMKIERFGLQQRFIRDQQTVLLGKATTVEDTPLAIRLRELGEERIANGFDTDRGDMGLGADISQAFDEASELLVDRYYTDRKPYDGFEGLSEEQKFALRYKEVAEITENLRVLGHYISPREYNDDACAATAVESVPANIWNASHGGAGLPIITPGVIGYLQGLFSQDPSLHVTAKEREQVALGRRNEIAALALQQTSDFVTSLSGHFHRALRVSHLQREEASKELKLSGGLKPQYVGVKDHYSAINLGCPALRERRTPVSMIANQLKEVHFIDNLVVVVLHEAGQRGLFAA